MRAYAQATADSWAQKLDAAVAAERERWAKALGASCAEERSQIWEAGPGGGCSRAIAAEASADEYRKERDDALATIDRLRAVLTACQEDAERMRMWGGMGWVWYSHYAATIHERCERSLGPNPSLASGEEAC